MTKGSHSTRPDDSNPPAPSLLREQAGFVTLLAGRPFGFAPAHTKLSDLGRRTSDLGPRQLVSNWTLEVSCPHWSPCSSPPSSALELRLRSRPRRRPPRRTRPRPSSISVFAPSWTRR